MKNGTDYPSIYCIPHLGLEHLLLQYLLSILAFWKLVTRLGYILELSFIETWDISHLKDQVRMINLSYARLLLNYASLDL